MNISGLEDYFGLNQFLIYSRRFVFQFRSSFQEMIDIVRVNPAHKILVRFFRLQNVDDMS